MNTILATDMVRRSAKVCDDDLDRLNLDEALGEVLDEVARESRAQGRRRRSRRVRDRGSGLRFGLTRPAVAALLVIGLLTAAAVPPVRAALGDVGDTLAGYFDGDDPPGQPLDSSDSPPSPNSPPAWLTADGRTGQRLLASAAGYELYIVRQPSGAYGFALDDSVGISDTAAGWERQFADNAIVILGPGPSTDAAGRRPLYGVAAGSVAEVEVRYESGSPTTAPAQSGGFVALMEPARAPTELVALDQDGGAIQEIDLHRFIS